MPLAFDKLNGYHRYRRCLHFQGAKSRYFVSRGKKNNNYIAERNRCHKRTKTLAPFNFVFQYIQSQTESFIVLLIIHRKLIINDT